MYRGRRHWFRVLLGLLSGLLLTAAQPAVADDVYLSPEAFLEHTFGAAVPAPSKLWVTRELRTAIREIMGHDLGALRLRYWQQGELTAWILEEIGKEQPITTGLVVDGDVLQSVQVLIYRESRGWEVKYPAFTSQFQGAGLDAERNLDRRIDGIAGATLSVQALTRLARLALLLDQHAASAGERAG